MVEKLTNIELYEKVRETGPSRSINFNIFMPGFNNTGLLFPLILGAPVAYAGLFRQITKYYNVFYRGKTVEIANSANITSTDLELADKKVPAATVLDFIIRNLDISYEEFQAGLVNQPLLLKQITVQNALCTTMGPDGQVVGVVPNSGFYPTSIGIFTGSQNRSALDKISPHTYINPNYGKPRNTLGVPQNNFFVAIPCECVLDENSAVVIDLLDNNGIGRDYYLSVSLTVCPIEKC